jgi:hypothetical protein
MRRIQLVLGALAIVVTSLVAFAGPAMADDLDCRNARGDLIRCDGELYAPHYNTSGYNNYPYPFYSSDAYYGDGPFYNEEFIDAFLDHDYEELLEEAAGYYYSYW